MKFCLLLFLFSIYEISGAQIFSGTVISKTDSNGLAYVNIGVIGKGIGTVSDETGNFLISLPESTGEDSLRFSICGYQSQSFKISELAKCFPDGKMKVALSEKIIHIPEVIIHGNMTDEILGNRSVNRGITGGFSSNQLGCEMGVLIKIKKAPTFVKNLSFFITKNIFDTLFFRINVYSVKEGMPYLNLLARPVYYNTTLKYGEITVDLSPYNIMVEDDFIISLEWVKNFNEKKVKEGLFFALRMGGAPTLYRHASQDSWKELQMVSLRFSTLVRY